LTQGDDSLLATIQEYGDRAAAEVQPRWRTVAKVLLVVAVIVVVALFAGPFVIGAVGAAAGALGATTAAAGVIGTIVGGAIVGAAAGAVIQIGNNLIDGREDWLEDVDKAMLAGAIGGALGGAGGVLGRVLGGAGRLGAGMTESLLKFGIDVAFDIVGGLLGDLSTGTPITLEGVLIGAGIGAAVSISTANLGRLGRFGRGMESIQARSLEVGGRFGQAVTPPRAPVSGRPAPEAPSLTRPEIETPRGATSEEGATPGARSSPETPAEANISGRALPETTPRSGGADVTPKNPPTIEGPSPIKTDASEAGGRRVHVEEAELDAGVVAKQTTPDGHEVKILEDGRIVRCSDCGEILDKYVNELAARPDLEQRLYAIDAEQNPVRKVQDAAELITQLEQHRFNRQQTLGTDPKRGYVAHEAEVGAMIEADYGGFRRDPSGDGEWISVNGPYRGKVFDLVGVPQGKSKFHSDAMERFLPSVDGHFNKSIDYVVLDTRYMRPAQKQTVLRYVERNFSSQRGRLILLE
jgi:hypothetical protein